MLATWGRTGGRARLLPACAGGCDGAMSDGSSRPPGSSRPWWRGRGSAGSRSRCRGTTSCRWWARRAARDRAGARSVAGGATAGRRRRGGGETGGAAGPGGAAGSAAGPGGAATPGARQRERRARAERARRRDRAAEGERRGEGKARRLCRDPLRWRRAACGGDAAGCVAAVRAPRSTGADAGPGRARVRFRALTEGRGVAAHRGKRDGCRDEPHPAAIVGLTPIIGVKATIARESVARLRFAGTRQRNNARPTPRRPPRAPSCGCPRSARRSSRPDRAS